MLTSGCGWGLSCLGLCFWLVFVLGFRFGLGLVFRVIFVVGVWVMGLVGVEGLLGLSLNLRVWLLVLQVQMVFAM